MSGPQEFDRAAVERIVRRAVSLGETTSGISSEALLDAADELGVDSDAMRYAISEEQLGLVPVPPAGIDRLVGPATVTASRLIAGSPKQVMGQVDTWLRRKGTLRRHRLGDGLAEYTRRSDVAATIQRTARSITGEETLDRVNRVRVRVNDVDGRQCLVAVSADLRVERAVAIAGGSGVAGVGSAVSVVEALTWTHWLWLGVPVSVGIGAGILVARASGLPDVETALAGSLDRIAAGEPPPGASGVSGMLGDVGRRLLAGRSRSAPPRPAPPRSTTAQSAREADR